MGRADSARIFMRCVSVLSVETFPIKIVYKPLDLAVVFITLTIKHLPMTRKVEYSMTNSTLCKRYSLQE